MTAGGDNGGRAWSVLAVVLLLAGSIVLGWVLAPSLLATVVDPMMARFPVAPTSRSRRRTADRR